MIHNGLLVAITRMLIRAVLTLLIGAPILLLGLGGNKSYAQSASQITPPNFRPSDRLPTGGLMIPDSSSIQIPPGAEKLRVWVGRVEYSGGRPELEPVHQEIAASLQKRIATTAELFEAARKLENAYIKAGYGLVRVGVAWSVMTGRPVFSPRVPLRVQGRARNSQSRGGPSARMQIM